MRGSFALVEAFFIVPVSAVWDGGFDEDSVLVNAKDSTATHLAAGTGEEFGNTAGQEINIRRDHTYLLAIANRLKKTCWPSTGMGGSTSDTHGWIIYGGTAEPAYESLTEEPIPLVLTWADVVTLPIEAGRVEFGGSRSVLIDVETPAHSPAD